MQKKKRVNWKRFADASFFDIMALRLIVFSTCSGFLSPFCEALFVLWKSSETVTFKQKNGGF